MPTTLNGMSRNPNSTLTTGCSPGDTISSPHAPLPHTSSPLLFRSRAVRLPLP